MRVSLVRVTSGVAVLAMLLAAGNARAQQQRTEDFTLFALAVAPTALTSIGFDLAMLGSLAGDGTVRRGYAITGLVFSLINGLMTLAALSAAPTNAGGARYTVPLCWASIAVTGATGALSIYSFSHSPPARSLPPSEPDPVEVPTPRPARVPAPRVDSGPGIDFLPTLTRTPAGLLTGGASLLMRW